MRRQMAVKTSTLDLKDVARFDAAAKDWRLTLAGWDQLNHRAELEQRADELHARSRITFLGPQFGAQVGAEPGVTGHRAAV